MLACGFALYTPTHIHIIYNKRVVEFSGGGYRVRRGAAVGKQYSHRIHSECLGLAGGLRVFCVHCGSRWHRFIYFARDT